MKIHSLILKNLIFLLMLVPSAMATEAEHEESKEIGRKHQSGSPIFSSEHWGISQEEVDYLFENSTDYIGISNTNHFKKVNKKLQEATGWNEQELIEHPLSFFWHPNEVSKLMDNAPFAKKKLSTWGFESRKKCKDGSYIWIQWITLSKLTKPLVAFEDQEFFCIGKDITQQKEQEEENLKALEESHKEIESLNRSLQDQNKILGAISEIQSAYIERRNSLPGGGRQEEDIYKTFEFILQQFIHLSESEYGLIGELFSDEDEQLFMQQVFGAAKNLTLDERSQQIINKYKGAGKKLCNFNNILGDVIATRKPLIINDVKNYSKPTGIPQGHIPINSCLGIPFIFKDKVIGVIALANRNGGYSDDLLQWLEPLSLVTGRIMNELKMQYWREEAERQGLAREGAEAANTAKSVFLAHMSHEIRTPLTGILGLMDLINKESLSEEDLSYLENAQMSGWSLMDLLNDILDISKIEAHQIKLEKIELNPVKVIQEVIQLLSPEAKKQKTSLTTTINPAVPDILIGDPTRLRQIYINLIANAIKFTNHGSVTVSLDGQESPETKNIFCLKGIVTDTGIGMKPETQERLFQPFAQADESMMRQFGGTGLGLFITRKLCELMNGNIKVSSQFGVGSTFEFNIQMGTPEKQASKAQYISPKKTEKLPKLRVLIAEDNPMNQLVLKTILNREGCTTTVVANGREAVEAVQKESYDLILMDGEMPEMNGLEATRTIRQMPNYQSLPIIGVTGHALDTHREQFLASGMNGYLTKPLNRDTLKAEILRCLKPHTVTI